MLECDFQLYQQSHSHSDEEYLSLLRHRLQLQKVRLWIVLFHTFRLHIIYYNLCILSWHQRDKTWETKCIYILVVLKKSTDTSEYKARLKCCSRFTLMKKSYITAPFFFLCVSLHVVVCVFQRCTEQVERLAECEKAILQMKSELERQ